MELHAGVYALHAGLYDTSVVYSSGAWTFYLFAHGFKGAIFEFIHYFRVGDILLKVAQFKGKIVVLKNATKLANLALYVHTTHHTQHAHTGAYTRAHNTSTHYARMITHALR